MTVDKVSERVLVLCDNDHFFVLFLFQDSKEYGHTFRSDLKEEILMLMARDQHPPEVGYIQIQVLLQCEMCASQYFLQHCGPREGNSLGFF